MKIAILSRWLWQEYSRAGQRWEGTLIDLLLALQQRGHQIFALSQSHDFLGQPLKKICSVPNAPFDLWLVPLKNRHHHWSIIDKLAKPFVSERKAFTDAHWLKQWIQSIPKPDLLWIYGEKSDAIPYFLSKTILRAPLPPACLQINAFPCHVTPQKITFEKRNFFYSVWNQATCLAVNSSLSEKILSTQYRIPQKKMLRYRVNLTHRHLALSATPRTTAASSNTLLYIGGLSPLKAPDLVMEVIERHKASFQNWHLRFRCIMPTTEGLTPFASSVLERAKILESQGLVQIDSRLDPESIAQAIQSASLIIVPSRIETFSRVALEALLNARPVIISSQAGAAEVIEMSQAGLVFSSGSSDALFQAITTWQQQRTTFETRALHASKLVAAEYHPLSCAEIWEEIFTKTTSSISSESKF
ncbi:MAG: glycosyltransferase family 4 protein [Methylacidiphilales bacterium]|nr:glycosyltransferase family 4 protein [Candidatus Methylacidiphilales bacterium]MDW8348918.1 glycosyltransferase family 4 protein [Verrucomicrobiae bacterium]